MYPEHPEKRSVVAEWLIPVCLWVFGVLPMGWLAYESSKPRELFAEYGSGVTTEEATIASNE